MKYNYMEMSFTVYDLDSRLIDILEIGRDLGILSSAITVKRTTDRGCFSHAEVEVHVNHEYNEEVLKKGIEGAVREHEEVQRVLENATEPELTSRIKDVFL